MFETYPKQYVFHPKKDLKKIIYLFIYFEKDVFPSVNLTKFGKVFFFG